MGNRAFLGLGPKSVFFMTGRQILQTRGVQTIDLAEISILVTLLLKKSSNPPQKPQPAQKTQNSLKNRIYLYTYTSIYISVTALPAREHAELHVQVLLSGLVLINHTRTEHKQLTRFRKFKHNLGSC